MSDGLDKEGQEFFGSLRFIGTRFGSANLPVDLLENVKAYQDVLLALAEDIWRERNPDSTRLPQNFRKKLSLSFSHIEDGSADAVLKSDPSVYDSFLTDEFSLNYMALAQTQFLKISKAANQNQPISGLNSSIKKPLLKLISNFREDESLEVKSRTGKDQNNPSVRYSKKTMLALSDAVIGPQIKPVLGMGIVRAILDHSEQIEVLSEHGIFKLPVPSEQLRDDRFPIAAFVEFEIQASVLSTGQVSKVLDTGAIKRISSNREHTRFLERLIVLTGLKDNWKDGLGKSIGVKAARYCNDLSGFICGIYSNVALFPELDGSIKIEFESNGHEVTVICKDDYIQLEVFDDSDNDPTEKTFFGISPKLLNDLSNLEGFKN
jgi:hypothetical protein